jgi:hypothetical protein
MHPQCQGGCIRLKHIIQVMQATLACVIMVAMVFSAPLFVMAFPIRLDVSFSSWKQLVPNHHPVDNGLPT